MDSYVNISKKSKRFPRRKRIPRTQDGILKKIVDDNGTELFFCILCREYKPKKEMSPDRNRPYGVDSYCRECNTKKNRIRMRQKWAEEHNRFGSVVPTGKLVGRRSPQTLRFPPMDAEIPLWYRGIGYCIGWYCKTDKGNKSCFP